MSNHDKYDQFVDEYWGIELPRPTHICRRFPHKWPMRGEFFSVAFDGETPLGIIRTSTQYWSIDHVLYTTIVPLDILYNTVGYDPKSVHELTGQAHMWWPFFCSVYSSSLSMFETMGYR